LAGRYLVHRLRLREAPPSLQYLTRSKFAVGARPGCFFAKIAPPHTILKNHATTTTMEKPHQCRHISSSAVIRTASTSP
jgi:hypothetical protein